MRRAAALALLGAALACNEKPAPAQHATAPKVEPQKPPEQPPAEWHPPAAVAAQDLADAGADAASGLTTLPTGLTTGPDGGLTTQPDSGLTTLPTGLTTLPAGLTTGPDGGDSVDGGALDAGAADGGAAQAIEPRPPGLTPDRLRSIQAALQAGKLDGWLLTDFRGQDPIAPRVLGLEGQHIISTRRWFCFIPARGQVQKLVPAIEPQVLDLVPGQRTLYASWRARDRELGRILRGLKTIAMDYSPRDELPMIARVDAGTIELVRAMGVEIASSAQVVAQVESTLDAAQLASMQRAAELVAADLEAVAQEAARRIRDGHPASERELQDFAVARWQAEGLEGGRPIVAVDEHTALPHYTPPAQGSLLAQRGSVLLLDFVARLPGDVRNVPADLTRVYFLGDKTPAEVARVAGLVFAARDAALELVRQRTGFGQAITGAEVDQVARSLLEKNGLGERFLHRTGHSIGPHGHGDGVNNDDFETHDARPHTPDTCFSIEPGAYFTGRFGIRSEIDVCLLKGEGGKLAIDVRGGPAQTSVPALLQ